MLSMLLIADSILLTLPVSITSHHRVRFSSRAVIKGFAQICSCDGLRRRIFDLGS